MDQEKRKMIYTEIENWQRNRLLPDQYSEFLLNLYDENQSGKDNHLLSLSSLMQGNIRSWLSAFGISSWICFVGFYFSVFSWPMQIFTALVFIGLCYAYAFVWRHTRITTSYTLTGMASFLLLGFGIWLIDLHQINFKLGSIILLLLCSLTWTILGYLMDIGLLHYFGFIGWALLYAALFYHAVPDASWWQVQMLWLPLSVLMIWFSWLVHHKDHKLPSVYFIVGITLWFMPEADLTILRGHSPEVMGLLSFIKIAIAFSLLFNLRKKWIAWVVS
ncbi:hypothetical protein PASE110613_03160 [Paenibacillus sediminis]|uniref:DUF2157 domain-containing protein n=1 Tax=Paenibacillus sediminis TaxID=664909 RepID=A0ABS4GYS0_9BACL|nr:hypothetical protein [Paenibacillus sediminis]MBP1935413.1 hypothetical protein [Paenibacillus sediminis]